MLKVGILTYHRSINYGAVMQSYALSQRLAEIENVEVEIIDYMSLRMEIYYKLFTLYRGKSGIHRLLDRLTMYSAFCKGIRQLPLSKKRVITDDERKFYKYIKDKYDVIVVGSDAVWNYEKRGLPNPYFLIGANVPTRVSYAASCNGIAYDKIDDAKLAVLRSALEKFDYLGVRDVLTEKVVAKALQADKVAHNCDPTLLLDFERDGLGDDFVAKLKEKLVQEYHLDPNKKYIGLMLSNFNGDFACKLVEGLKARYGNTHQIISIYSYCKYADVQYLSNLTPFEWSRIFSLFDITFSKYFHGTLLSIKNETPVIALGTEHCTEDIPAKLEDVLTRMDLMEFYSPAKSAVDLDDNTFFEKVDEFMRCPPVDKMRKVVQMEARYADGFFVYINSICKKERE